MVAGKGYFVAPKYAPKSQPDATVDVAPVSGTKYTLLDTTRNVRVKSVIVKVTWTVQPTPLEVHMTIDGITYLFSKVNPASATTYYPTVVPDADEVNGFLGTVSHIYSYGVPFMFEARSAKIEVEITGGTVSNLTARCKYSKW